MTRFEKLNTINHFFDNVEEYVNDMHLQCHVCPIRQGCGDRETGCKEDLLEWAKEEVDNDNYKRTIKNT